MLSDSPGQTWGTLFATALAAYDFNVDFQDISKRLDDLMKEIREIQEINARYWELSVQTQDQRAAYDTRQLRLLQIKEELAKMKTSSERKATLRWQIGEKF